jgi:hypothetical protein
MPLSPLNHFAKKIHAPDQPLEPNKSQGQRPLNELSILRMNHDLN